MAKLDMKRPERITERTWDLAELKWMALSLGASVNTTFELEPLATLDAGCAFCNLLECEGCPLFTAHGCCDGLYIKWENASERMEQRRAGNVLAFIRWARQEWKKADGENDM